MLNTCKLLNFNSDLELATAVAKTWLPLVADAQRGKRLHTAALSGGRITKAFFNAVVTETKATDRTLEPVHFFWADERCVPPHDAESNFKMAEELLFQPLATPAANIHRIKGELSQAEAVSDITKQLEFIATKNSAGMPMIDVIFLGMGEDGHVASLFPDASMAVLKTTEVFCAINNSPKPPPRRISLTYAAIAAAREVFVLVSGAGKEKALRDSLDRDSKTPLGKVIQIHPSVTIFSDLKP